VPEGAEGGDGEEAGGGGGVFGFEVKSFSRLGDGDAVRVGVGAVDLVTGGQAAGFEDAEVKADAEGGEEALGEAGVFDGHGEFGAWAAGEGDFKLTGADRITVAEVDLVVGHIFDGEVFAEEAEVEVVAAVGFAPVVVDLAGEGVDGHVRAAVVAFVGLLIAVEAEFFDGDRAGAGCFVDAGADGFAVVLDGEDRGGVDLQELHGSGTVRAKFEKRSCRAERG